MDTEALVSVLMRAHLSSRVLCSDGEIARSGRREKKRRRIALTASYGIAMAPLSVAHEHDALVRAYPLWRFRLSKPKFPSCCINRHRSCGVTHAHTYRLICFSRPGAEFGMIMQAGDWRIGRSAGSSTVSNSLVLPLLLLVRPPARPGHACC